jgi:DNA-binding beta-propeller fold protein YncE
MLLKIIPGGPRMMEASADRCDSTQFVKPIPLGKPGVIKPMSVLLSRDASKLYVSTVRGQQVFTVDTATNSMVGLSHRRQTTVGIELSPDGKTLYSANRASNDISM